MKCSYENVFDCLGAELDRSREEPRNRHYYVIAMHVDFGIGCVGEWSNPPASGAGPFGGAGSSPVALIFF